MYLLWDIYRDVCAGLVTLLLLLVARGFWTWYGLPSLKLRPRRTRQRRRRPYQPAAPPQQHRTHR